jgi:predicted dehydrogenase
MSYYLGSDRINKDIWLIGCGGMAMSYLKVLEALDAEFNVIGRGRESAENFEETTGHKVISGGLKSYLSGNPRIPSRAIVAVGAEHLEEVSIQLLNFGVKCILVEKPASLTRRGMESLSRLAEEKKAEIFVAYNRRFYASVFEAQKIIVEDGGLASLNFEFTEWAHEVVNLNHSQHIKQRWFLANSTHVVDLAFYLAGQPDQIAAFKGGALSWHPSGSIFAGAGITKRGALFSYQANWESAGRWGLELLTKNNRLILRPLEQLWVQKKGTLTAQLLDGDYKLDELFKPGLYRQVCEFLSNERQRLCSIEEQTQAMTNYDRIAGYA